MAPRDANNPLRPANWLKKPRHNSSQSSQMLLEWEQIEENWCTQKCDSLSPALIQNVAPRPSTSQPYFDSDMPNDENELDYEYQHHFEDDNKDDPPSSDPESNTESNDSQQSIASNPGTGITVTAASGITNQMRRIREEKQWQEVIAPMFKVFMLCKQETFNWSRSNWDLDRKDQC
ncbi:uncharacterized protein MELLADRAFT_60541 [Melampsora larici-populina 98AG31]|uniref:Uncharacterized protein n=1 Tax=Melampsora larici-populina (strain 98AG31 / pathotype 3-4-7) TaxID=747676 RepID=F4RB48_MELLP|nr:uncharacterized protein MELLADRAFT_60541 [Melampsora larici-populina 98AG31]EGG10097.1 hypothetical protein MELLADRAFT_60541 [Melampsora larici-populina 98AG31]